MSKSNLKKRPYKKALRNKPENVTVNEINIKNLKIGHLISDFELESYDFIN